MSRSVLFYFVGAVLLGSTGYLVFELGRYQADYSLLDQRREREAFQQQVGDQVATAEELRRQVTVLQTSQEIDRETYAQVERDFSQLQQRIQAQEEELAFYQGIISPEDGHAGLRVQTLDLAATELDRHYLLRLVLVQTISRGSRGSRVSGTLKLTIEGSRDGEFEVLQLDEVVLKPGLGDIPFEFRYFQSLQRELVLPADFEPNQVNVEIWPRESEGQPILYGYTWPAVVGEKVRRLPLGGDEQ
jgi:hypothetical protein